MNRFVRVLCLIAYDVSLRSCPREFRREFGPELRSDFARLLEEAGRLGGTRHTVWLALRAAHDSLGVALTHRRWLSRPLAALRLLPDPRLRYTAMIRTTLKDAAHGVRMLRRRPGLALAATATLALGIGANTAIFSVVNAVLLRPLPFPEPERLVRAYHANTERGFSRGSLSFVDLADWEERQRSFSHLGLYTTLPSGPLLTGVDEPVELRAAYVTRGFFGALGREALHGRVLRDAEEAGDNRVVVLSHGFWQRRFGGDPAVVGSPITLDDGPFTVVGVMPPDFVYPDAQVEAWVFVSVIPTTSVPTHIRGVRLFQAVGRLRPEVDMATAERELSAVVAALSEEFPNSNGNLDSAALQPLAENIVGDIGDPLLLSLAGVSLVLLLACANVAGLLVARSAERRRELAVRAALGAGRGRLLRQLLTENLVLSSIGGIAGVALASLITPVLIAGAPDGMPRLGEVDIDLGVLGAATLVTALTGVVFGVFPAWLATRRPGTRLGGRAVTLRRGGGVLVAAEVALAVIVVVAAGLLVRTVRALQAVEMGIDEEHVVAVSLTFNDARYPSRAEYLVAYQAQLDSLAGLSGVDAVGTIRFVPTDQAGEQHRFTIAGQAEPEQSSESQLAWMLQVSPGFFAAAAVEGRAGRFLDASDAADSEPVAVINETMQRRFWGEASAVGEQLDTGDELIRIVGVVADVRQRGPLQPAEPTFYRPQVQDPRRGMAFLVRTQVDPQVLVPAIREAIRSVDPDQPIRRIDLASSLKRDAIASQRYFAGLLGGTASLALILACVGIFGVVSNSVARRTSEIGLRLALGAKPRRVVRMIVREAMMPVLAGVLTGVLAAIAMSRSMAGVVHGVAPLDPTTFAVATAILLVFAGTASWLPARRSAAVDPTRALRADG